MVMADVVNEAFLFRRARPSNFWMSGLTLDVEEVVDDVGVVVPPQPRRMEVSGWIRVAFGGEDSTPPPLKLACGPEDEAE